MVITGYAVRGLDRYARWRAEFIVILYSLNFIVLLRLNFK
jgi:hypothetical protein